MMPMKFNTRRGPVNILVAHPQEDMMLRLQLALRAIHTPVALYHVRDAQSLFSFLRKAEPYETALRPDMIMLGDELLEVLGRLKSDTPFAAIPVIVIAEKLSRETARNCHARLANACVRIPADTAGMRLFAGALDAFWFHTAKLPPNPDA
jgi:CheY-like chemotaxis protein